MIEERPVFGFENEGYRIRSNGQLWNPHTRKWTYGTSTWCGGPYYARVGLWKHGRRHFKNMHRLAAEHFVCNPRLFVFDVVDHINMDPLDNSAENLRWVNAQLNSRNQKGKPYWVRKWKKWVVQVNGSTRGYFRDRATAQRVRDETSKREFDELYLALTTGHY